MPGAQTWKEIHEQPDEWRKVLDRVEPLQEIAGKEHVLFLGAGIALYLARALAAYTTLVSGRIASAWPSQDLFLYPALWTGGSSAAVILARTGDVTDAVRAVESLRSASRASLVAVIGEQGGPLEELCHRTINTRVFEESVVTTKTFSSMALASLAAIRMAQEKKGVEDLAALPDAAQKLLGPADEVARELSRSTYDHIVFCGTGPFFGMAEASALTVQEMAIAQAVGRHTLVYPHGHKVTITDRTLVVFNLSDTARSEELKVLAEARRLGARTLVVGERLADVQADFRLETDSGLRDLDRLPLYAIPAQFIGYRLAMARGVDPDRPYSLPKVF